MGLERFKHTSLRAVLKTDAAAAAFPAALDSLGTVERFAGDQAMESRVTQDPVTWDIVHIACPADYAQPEAMENGLLLGADDASDGRVHPRELLAATMPVSLAVVDAQMDGVAPGQARRAFAAGFLHAGAAAYLTNLWPVDEVQAGALFQAFYTNLATMDKAQALREAKLALMRANPASCDWAAFVLEGDYR
jgi:CHAT domain-containing protein